MKPIKVGLIGLGTVGAGTVNVLHRNADEIARRAGRQIIPVMAAVKSLAKSRELLTDIEITDNPMDVVNHPEIDVVIELMGGEDLSFKLLIKAIENKKHIVTANKALIAKKGNELFEKAYKAGVIIAFEAAVAGGIPVIKAIREGLTANRIEQVSGIINGTSNYILTEMQNQQASFQTMLDDAQELGYAEADPSFDVGGIDAAHKITILASIAYGLPLKFDQAYIEGIDEVRYEDIQFAESFGYVIKSLAIARKYDHGVELRVHPVMIPKTHMLASVNGVMNAIMIKADAVGNTLYYGPGAGAEPTASSVVADIVDVVRAITTDSKNRVPHLAFQPDQISDLPIIKMEEISSAYYLNITVKDRPGVLAAITSQLASQGISIKAITQHPIKDASSDQAFAEIVILTYQAQEKQLNLSLDALNKLDAVSVIRRIRIEELDGQ